MVAARLVGEALLFSPTFLFSITVAGTGAAAGMMEAAMGPPDLLIDMPIELLHKVFSYLSARDQSALMRTCRSLHRSLLPEMHKGLPVLHLGSLAYDFTREKLNTWLKEKEARLANDKWGREELDEKRASDQKHLKKLTPMSVERLFTPGCEPKIMILHCNYFNRTSRQYLTDAIISTYQQIADLSRNTSRLEVFGFTDRSNFSFYAVRLFTKFLLGSARLRILLLPHRKLWENWDYPSWYFKDHSTILDFQLRIRRGDAPMKQYVDLVPQTVRENVYAAPNGRKYLDLYAFQGSDPDAIKTAINQPGNTLEEVSIFGIPRASYQNNGASTVRMNTICDNVGLKFEDLEGLHFYQCQFGPVSSFADMKISDRLRSLSIINNCSKIYEVKVLEHHRPGEFKEFSTVKLLERVAAAHQGSSMPKLNRFIYRQHFSNCTGSKDDPHDPLPNEALRKFIGTSDTWEVLCVHHDQEYDGSLLDFASESLVYCSLYMGTRRYKNHELSAFAEMSPNIQWFGIYYPAFTHVIENERLPDNVDEKMGRLATALKPMQSLRVLCLFSSPPSRGNNPWARFYRDTMVATLALKCAHQGIHLHYIHLVMRNPASQQHQWEGVQPTRTYRIEDKVSWVDYLEDVPKIRRMGKRATRVAELPGPVKEELEAMGGGRRLDLRCVLRDTLGEWYHECVMEDVLEKKWEVFDEKEKVAKALVRAKATKALG